VRGAKVVYTRVPVTVLKEVEFTGIENVFALIIVAVKVPFTAAQLPVPPEMFTSGRELVLKP
jgi:hypothetical protein